MVDHRPSEGPSAPATAVEKIYMVTAIANLLSICTIASVTTNQNGEDENYGPLDWRDLSLTGRNYIPPSVKRALDRHHGTLLSDLLIGLHRRKGQNRGQRLRQADGY